MISGPHTRDRPQKQAYGSDAALVAFAPLWSGHRDLRIYFTPLGFGHMTMSPMHNKKSLLVIHIADIIIRKCQQEVSGQFSASDCASINVHIYLIYIFLSTYI